MDSLLAILVTPLKYGFMQQALLVAVVVGVVCALLSCFLVLRGWSLMGDAISHAILPGVVLASVVGLPLSVGAFFSGLLCALTTGYIHSNSRVREDTVLGIIFAGMFALGILMFTSMDTEQHLSHILFGNILGIERDDLWQVLIISGFVITVMALKWRDLLLFIFDPSHARIAGLPTRWLHYGLLVLLALTSVAAIQAVGVVLVVAMLIAPGITAQLVCRRFGWMLVVACAVSVCAGVLGVILSFHFDASTSACIVLTQAALFVLALIWQRLSVIYRFRQTAI
ncbi:metal ABC transporter permease [Suttonella sp. R2A3]|uniref:metal ABC transporter permease n=1 Tax=Suttonella sp. R2A3 TaxID=2908648 RepID=UPI001F3782A7|nr:metal ABC transporter permease [Suttonella sp. R2A3]UJF24645.1 metal ABC transporter permease [Suttonella sp. R2A3]